jgi:hypothetical protein
MDTVKGIAQPVLAYLSDPVDICKHVRLPTSSFVELPRQGLAGVLLGLLWYAIRSVRSALEDKDLEGEEEALVEARRSAPLSLS